MRKETTQWLVPVVLAVGVAGALWFYWAQSGTPDRPAAEEATPAEAPSEEAPATEAPAEPVHPLPMPDEDAAAAADEPELQPLPPLNESDDYFAMALTDLFGEGLDEPLVDRRLAGRIVATVDNLPRKNIAENIRPLDSVPGKFIVEKKGDELSLDEQPKFEIGPENYQRYDALVAMIGNTDAAAMAELYRRFYPLLQQAYVDLGYPDAYFNDRVVEVIDHLLATPEVDEPVLLVRPNVMYEFADPELEKLSSGQKTLIRIGSENAAIIKEKLRQFRKQITSEQQNASQ